MIGLDTSFLIDLYWLDSPRHMGAVNLFNSLSDERYINEQICIYYNCFNEFLHVITDSRRFDSAISIEKALDIVEQWRMIDRVKIVFPTEMSFCRTLTWLSVYKLGRKRLNDTNMAACYAALGVSSIITANPHDFEILKVFNTINY